MDKCPKCEGELESRGRGAYWYGHHESYEWFCTKCGYSEEEHMEAIAE